MSLVELVALDHIPPQLENGKVPSVHLMNSTQHLDLAAYWGCIINPNGTCEQVLYGDIVTFENGANSGNCIQIDRRSHVNYTSREDMLRWRADQPTTYL